MSSRNTLITIVVLVVILAGGAWLTFFNNDDGNSQTKCIKVENNMTNSQIPTVTNVPVGQTLPAEYSNKKARVTTNCGTFVVEFFDTEAPLAVQNFIRLAQAGSYNNVPFHRIMSGFMIQGGDYTRGDGTGGGSTWGQSFPDELNPEAQSYKMGYKRGVMAMANAGPNTNGSQFFIMHQDFPLPPNYTIFARVIEGLEVIDKIALVPVLENAFGELSVPSEKIIVEQIVVEDK